MGRTIGAVSFLQILAPELNDRMLADFLEMDSNITVNFHIRTIDQAKAIKSIKSKITDLDKMKIEEQKGSPLRLRYGHHPVRSCHLRRRGEASVAGSPDPQ